MTPPSTARRTIGSAAASSIAQRRPSCGPKLIIPRQTRDTRRPVAPRFTYSTSARYRSGLVHQIHHLLFRNRDYGTKRMFEAVDLTKDYGAKSAVAGLSFTVRH